MGEEKESGTLTEAQVCPGKTRTDLAWDQVLRAISDRCETAIGKRDARTLPFAPRDATRRVLRETFEAARLSERGEEIPVLASEPVDEALGRLRVGGALLPEELRHVAGMLSSARVLRRFLSRHRQEAEALYDACATDPTLDRLADEVLSSFDPDGTLKDSATPELKGLRADRQAARQRMLSRLEEIMSRYDGVLQDRFVTEREGRFVLPVRSDSHERFPGIVHSTSASGATIFVEPRVVVPLGNRLKMLDAEVAREEAAIYARLSGLLGDSLASIEAARDRVALADIKRAMARMARELRLIFPEIVEVSELDLRGLRHVLLALEEPHVVASDVFTRGGQVLVVSGPNAGGKTVALKALGLSVLMLRAGLPLACEEGSRAGIFDCVLTDVGDDQSIEKSLSTFSAHIRNLSEILGQAGNRSLVLLDELCGGTDPREGEALAVGVLDSLAEKGAAVVATTHYEGLKVLSSVDTRFRNASVGMESSTMTPTFRVILDLPGSSSALAVARRFGLAESVVERAERFLSDDRLDFESALRKIHDERASLDFARAAVARQEIALLELRGQLEAEIASYRQRETRHLSHEVEGLLTLIRRAKEEVRTAESRLRKRHVDVAEFKEASRAVDRASGLVAVGGELEPLLRPEEESPTGPVALTELRVGMRVFVPRLRAKAEIIQVETDGSVRVAAGPLKVRVTVEELRKAEEEPEARSRKDRPNRGAPKTRPVSLEPAISTSENTCDLRGLGVDDGVALAITFLDRSLYEKRSIAFLLHGHGTGALRDAIRKELKETRSVVYCRPGTSDEGGDGVTVVWLA